MTKPTETAKPVPHAGRLSHRVHIVVYLILAVLVAVDYVLLSQALILLNSAQSATGSMGPQTYVLTVGLSLMMILLPHAAGYLVRLVADGARSRLWLRAVWVLVGLWAVILAVVTIVRITSTHAAGAASTTSGLLGATSQADAGPSLFSPETLMSILTVLALAVTGVISFLLTWYTFRPLRTSSERVEAAALVARTARDAAKSALEIARGTVETASKEDERDRTKLALAQDAVTARLGQLRSDVAEIIVENDGDPQATSQMIRALREQRALAGVKPGSVSISEMTE